MILLSTQIFVTILAFYQVFSSGAYDGLGLNTDGYNRDGLRAVAHLGGKSGMRRFVQSAGKYNPSDELGTSLQDYYDKFAS